MTLSFSDMGRHLASGLLDQARVFIDVTGYNNATLWLGSSLQAGRNPRLPEIMGVLGGRLLTEEAQRSAWLSANCPKFQRLREHA